MVALLHPDTDTRRPQHRPDRHPGSLPRSSASGSPRLASSHLRVVEGGAAKTVDGRVLVAVAVVALMLLVLGVRVMQGAPPADTWAGLESSASTSATAGTAGADGSSVLATGTSGVASATSSDSVGDVWLVADGDTWWQIASEVAPQSDTGEVVKALTAANGGAGLAVGQLVVIPASILS